MTKNPNLSQSDGTNRNFFSRYLFFKKAKEE